MHFLLLALIAALRVAGASSTYFSGSLTTVTTDTVPLALRGDEWATAQFVVSSAGTATATAQVSIDGGTNWTPSPLCKRLNTVSANPTVQAITATTLVTADTWECPLPGNATHFRLQCGGTGTTTSVQISNGAPYVPGVPVRAVLADVNESGTGVGIASTIFDFSGWQAVTVYMSSPTTQVFTVRPVDDAGSFLANLAQVGTATSASTVTFLASGGAHQTMPNTLIAGAWVAATLAEKRYSIALPAGGTATAGRYRITASR